jgi:hypothetical protein
MAITYNLEIATIVIFNIMVIVVIIVVVANTKISIAITCLNGQHCHILKGFSKHTVSTSRVDNALSQMQHSYGFGILEQT